MGESPGIGREISQRNYDVAVTKPLGATNFSICSIPCGLPTTERGIPRSER
jgi:hypothetical protein